MIPMIRQNARSGFGLASSAVLGSTARLASAAVLALAAACAEADSGDSRQASGEVGEPADADRSSLLVYAVNYPLAYFAERIGGDLVQVEFPAPPDVDPAFWSPDPEMVAAYQSADLILLNGAGYASWTDRVSLASSRLVVTTEDVADRYVVVEDAVTHSHGPEGEHAHGTVAFTTWLDPTIGAEQARAIRDAFVRARPSAEVLFGEGFDALEADLLDLDVRLSQIVAARPEQPLLASHPVYQYLAARYGLDLRSVHFEPDEPPGPAAWRDLEEMLEERSAGWMMLEAEPLPETAARLR
ncbi:MAG: metal ABC transporter substrate-binding protein, partial [Gemmatimonadota bacterium]